MPAAHEICKAVNLISPSPVKIPTTRIAATNISVKFQGVVTTVPHITSVFAEGSIMILYRTFRSSAKISRHTPIDTRSTYNDSLAKRDNIMIEIVCVKFHTACRLMRS